MIREHRGIKYIKNDNAINKVFSLVRDHWKLFKYSIGGYDGQEGYIFAKEKEDCIKVLSKNTQILTYRPEAYKIEKIKVTKKFLKLKVKLAKEEKISLLEKHIAKRTVELFYMNKDNYDEYNTAEIIIANLNDEGFLL